jgi:hypothetical protein
LGEPVQPFPGHGGIEIREAGDVAAGVGETIDEMASDWIGDLREHDRYRRQPVTP